MRAKQAEGKGELPLQFDPAKFRSFIRENLSLDLEDFREAMEQTDYRRFDLAKVEALVKRSEKAARISLESAAIAMAAAKRAAAINRLLIPRRANRERHLAKLSPAQGRVYRGLERGQTNKEIAGQLGLSVQTIKVHVKNILSRLDAKNRRELISAGSPY